MHVQAIHQFHAMIFNRLGADLQDVADLLGGLAFGDELEHLALPARQLIERAFASGGSIRGKLLVELRGNFPAQINFSANDPLQGGFQFGAGRLFEQVADDARLQPRQ